MKKMKMLFAAMAILGTTACNADPVRWYLDGVTFDDGATASGWFDEDPANGAMGRFVIYTTNGSTTVGRDYVDGQASATNYVALGNSTPTYQFQRTDRWSIRFKPFAALPAGGGPVALDLSDTNNNVECDNCGTYRVMTAGQLIGVTDEVFGNGFDD